MASASNLLSELTDACHSKAAPSDDRLIELGESTWFCGVPAHAEEGTVALGFGDLEIIIRQQDVRAVKKKGRRYAVEVSSDANVLVRIEKAVKAKPRRHQPRREGQAQCRCGEGHGAPRTIRQEEEGGQSSGPLTLEIGTACIDVCVEVPVELDDRTQLMTVCLCVPTSLYGGDDGDGGDE
jgi:hypothetical protein